MITLRNLAERIRAEGEGTDGGFVDGIEAGAKLVEEAAAGMGAETEEAHGFAEQAMGTALSWEAEDRFDIRDDVRELGRAVQWLAAETRAARLERRSEVG